MKPLISRLKSAWMVGYRLLISSTTIIPPAFPRPPVGTWDLRTIGTLGSTWSVFVTSKETGIGTLENARRCLDSCSSSFIFNFVDTLSLLSKMRLFLLILL